MEPVSLTLGWITARLVAEALDKTVDRTVEGAAGVVGRLVGWLRERFSGDDEESGTTALARVEDAPDSPSRIRELAEELDQRAETDVEFRATLEALVAEARSSTSVTFGSITGTVQGNRNVQPIGVVDSEIHVVYGEPPQSSGH